MKRVLLISLSLVLALVGWSAVGADAQVSNKVVVIPIFTDYIVAPVPKTGQTTPYGERDDGALKSGVASPSPRFTDNGNGTVTDKLTRLIWMKDAGVLGTKTWLDALATANTLAPPMAGLRDGSVAGDWRLPSIRELQSLVDYGRDNPAFPEVHPFSNVLSSIYWSSTTASFYTIIAWCVNFEDGIGNPQWKEGYVYVWCVRGGP